MCQQSGRVLRQRMVGCEFDPQLGPTKDLKNGTTESLPSTQHFRENVWEEETAGV